jgi:peptidyl-prolyl cis-trans isomerase B (cyclophilin B)
MTHSSQFLMFYRQFWATVLVLLLTACSSPSNSVTAPEVSSPSPTAATQTNQTESASSSAQSELSEPLSSSIPPGAEATSSAATPPGAQATAPVGQPPKLVGDATVVLKVKGQLITIAINGKDAPITAGNFVDLVDRGVYDGTAFHRVVRTPSPFVVQGGDPQSKDVTFPIQQLGTGNFIDPKTKVPRYIPLEILPEDKQQPIYSKTLKSAGVRVAPKLKHTKGAVAMARAQDPDSASAQFYFALADLQFLDGDYAVFGYVTEGMTVVDQIQQGDRIESAKVTKGLENLKR